MRKTGKMEEPSLQVKETSGWKHPRAKPLEQGGGLEIDIWTEHWMFCGDPLPTCISLAPPAHKTRYVLSPTPYICTSESCLLGTVRIPGALSLQVFPLWSSDVDWSEPWLLCPPLLWVMALHHSFPSLPAALLLDTCLSNCHACTPALVLTWGVQEAQVSLSGIQRDVLLFDPAPPAGMSRASTACSWQAWRQRVLSCLCHLWLRAALREGSAWHAPT